MLLKRGTQQTWWEWFRLLVWPRRSWMRSGQYVAKRILRITATPHAVAAGVAAGAFTSFTPFMGFHFLTAALIAWVLRGNLLASALGTFFGNPITFPFIWATSLSTGRRFLGLSGETAPIDLATAFKEIASSIWRFDGELAARGLAAIWEPVFLPMMIGGLPWGILIGVVAYWATRRACLIFRDARRDKLMAKAAKLRDEARLRAAKRAIASEGSVAP